MRIGIYAGEWHPHTGGGFTFFETIYNGLIKSKSEHEFFVFAEQAEELPKDFDNFKFIALKGKENKDSSIDYQVKKNKLKSFLKNLPPFKNIYSEIKHLKEQNEQLKNQITQKQNEFTNYENRLNKEVVSNKIELFWFLTPIYIPVEVPYIYTLWDLAHLNHPYFPEVNYTGWRWENRENQYEIVLRKAAYIIVGTEEGRKETSFFYKIPQDRIIVIPFTPASFTISQSNQRILHERYIFYPAQFWPHKNHILILLAIKKLKSEYNIVLHCVFTGSDKGNLDFIQKKTVELNINDQIHFLGFVSKDELQSLYQHAEALVFPSFFGPDNLPPIEAMTLGCPVIASDIPGARDQLKDAAIYFDPCSENELSNFLIQFLTNKIDRKTLREKGNNLCSTIMTDNYIKKIENIFTEFIGIRRCWSNNDRYIHL